MRLPARSFQALFALLVAGRGRLGAAAARRFSAAATLLAIVALSVSGAWAAAQESSPTQEDPPESSEPDPSNDPSPEGSPDEGSTTPSEDPTSGDPAGEGGGEEAQPEIPAEAPAEPEPLEPPSKRERRVPDHYIVVFKKSVEDVEGETREREQAGGFKSRLRYRTALKGFAAKLSRPQLERLQADPEVDFITPDREVKASGTVPLAAGEPLPPTGIRRIEAATSTTAHEASGIAVAVIDTGIQLGHSDLDASHGTNCVTSGAQANDDNGHGSHVAGTIAAKNNGSGVVGVAPGTKLYAAKVLNQNGSGTLSQVICGIDWVTANASALNIKVANMSLSGGGPSVKTCSTTTDAEHKAICNSTAAGVTYVVAAGNSGWDFDYAPAPDLPAAYPEVLTVTAVSDSDGLPGASGPSPSCRSGESDDRYASFSNYAATSAGQAHTIAGPGVCIKSTWTGGGYNTISGTSMASPHVAGAVALCVKEGGTQGGCAGMSPAQIIQKMRSDAQNHTTANLGYGFVGDPSHPVSGKYFGYLDRVGITGSTPDDTTAPTVTSVSPADQATGVGLTGNVSVTFSEPMNKASAEGAFSLVRSGGSEVPGTFSWTGNTMTFDPTGNLAQGERYTATVSTAAKDAADNPLAASKVWSFTTIDFVEGTTIVTGTPRTTSPTTPPRLDADDGVYFAVNSTTSGTRTSSWYGSFLAVPTNLSALTVTYRGKNSRNCTQTVSIWDWTANAGAGTWVTLDSRSVSTSETTIQKQPSGTLSRFVGPSGDEVRVRIRCTRGSPSFYASGDLLQLAYTKP